MGSGSVAQLERQNRYFNRSAQARANLPLVLMDGNALVEQVWLTRPLLVPAGNVVALIGTGFAIGTASLQSINALTF